MGDMMKEGSFIDLGENPKKLNDVGIEEKKHYPSLYIGKDKIKEAFRGAKVGETYSAMVKCEVSGDGLTIYSIKPMKESQAPNKDDQQQIETETEGSMDAGDSGEGSEGE